MLAKNEKVDIENLSNVGDAVGIGLLRVTRYLYNKPEPIQGIVPLQKGDLATDLAYYFTQSEQIPTAVVLDVDIDDNGKITQSAGLLIQALPGASSEDLKKIYDQIVQLQPITRLYYDELLPEIVLKKILPFDYDVINSTKVDFFCRCSKERFMGKLKTIGYDEIEDMKRLNQKDLICQYCSAHYELEEDDFDKLLSEIKADMN